MVGIVPARMVARTRSGWWAARMEASRPPNEIEQDRPLDIEVIDHGDGIGERLLSE